MPTASAKLPFSSAVKAMSSPPPGTSGTTAILASDGLPSRSHAAYAANTATKIFVYRHAAPQASAASAPENGRAPSMSANPNAPAALHKMSGDGAAAVWSGNARA